MGDAPQPLCRMVRRRIDSRTASMLPHAARRMARTCRVEIIATTKTLRHDFARKRVHRDLPVRHPMRRTRTRPAPAARPFGGACEVATWRVEVARCDSHATHSEGAEVACDGQIVWTSKRRYVQALSTPPGNHARTKMRRPTAAHSRLHPSRPTGTPCTRAAQATPAIAATHQEPQRWPSNDGSVFTVISCRAAARKNIKCNKVIAA